MLKADLHIHTSEDPYDRISYTARELIDYASSLGFEVISITNHEKVTFSRSLEEYAAKKGILLIPGAEAFIEKADVLIYNAKQEDIAKIKRIADLAKLKKRKNVLIAAPHPYYIHRSLGKKLEKNISLFDAIEYSHFYLKHMNRFNEKAARLARKNKIPLIGTSDSHKLWKMNTTYTLIDSKKDISSVIGAIKKGKVRVVSRHLGIFGYARAFFEVLFAGKTKRIKKAE